MKANTLSINIYIYILVCLVCLTSSDKEGYFFIATSNKAWKFILNNSTNAKKLADKLKNEGPMNITFFYKKNEENGNSQEYYSYENDVREFKFSKYDGSITSETYDIGGYSLNDGTEFLEINLSESLGPYDWTKIGKLIDGEINEKEFALLLCIKDQEMIGYCTATFTLAYTEVDDEKVAKKSKFPWLIILILIFAALGISIPIYAYFF